MVFNCQLSLHCPDRKGIKEERKLCTGWGWRHTPLPPPSTNTHLAQPPCRCVVVLVSLLEMVVLQDEVPGVHQLGGPVGGRVRQAAQERHQWLALTHLSRTRETFVKSITYKIIQHFVIMWLFSLSFDVIIYPEAQPCPNLVLQTGDD